MVVGPGLVSTSSPLLRSITSHPADPHGRLAQNMVIGHPLLGAGGSTQFAQGLPDRYDSSTACRLCRLEQTFTCPTVFHGNTTHPSNSFVIMKSFGAMFLRPDVLPGINHMCGMQYQKVLYLTFLAKIQLILLHNLCAQLPHVTPKINLHYKSSFSRLLHIRVMVIIIFIKTSLTYTHSFVYFMSIYMFKDPTIIPHMINIISKSTCTQECISSILANSCKVRSVMYLDICGCALGVIYQTTS